MYLRNSYIFSVFRCLREPLIQQTLVNAARGGKRLRIGPHCRRTLRAHAFLQRTPSSAPPRRQRRAPRPSQAAAVPAVFAGNVSVWNATAVVVAGRASLRVRFQLMTSDRMPRRARRWTKVCGRRSLAAASNANQRRRHIACGGDARCAQPGWLYAHAYPGRYTHAGPR